jgi:hypothetical protein
METVYRKNVSVVVYFTTVPISKRYINERQNDRWMREDLEHGGRDLIQILSWYLIRRPEESHNPPSVRIASDPTEIRTAHFPNKSLQRHSYTDLLRGNIYLAPKSYGKGYIWPLTKYMPNTLTYSRKNNQGRKHDEERRLKELKMCAAQ